jgi:hypothetical protein
VSNRFVVARTFSNPFERKQRASYLFFLHFQQRTGIHFVGKCSSFRSIGSDTSSQRTWLWKGPIGTANDWLCDDHMAGSADHCQQVPEKAVFACAARLQSNNSALIRGAWRGDVAEWLKAALC